MASLIAEVSMSFDRHGASRSCCLTEPFPSPTNESRVQKAWQALLDFGEDVVPSLWQLIADGDKDQRKNAAEALRWLRREIGIPLTDEQRQRIIAVRPDINVAALR